MDWTPIKITFLLAAITTAVLLCLSIPLAAWLARTQSRAKPVLEAIVSLPLVLPPTVLGFYLLIAFSPNSALGGFLSEQIGLQLVFSFEGLVVASVIYSLPFMVHPLQAGFRSLPPELAEASYALGKSRWTTLIRVLLPNIRSALLTGIVLTFAHTLGEFGVVLMIGGSIPGETKVASIAIYEGVESMNYAHAHVYSLVLLSITFVVLLFTYIVNGKRTSLPWG